MRNNTSKYQLTLFAAFFVQSLTHTLFASDLPFGAGTLGSLADKAALVVRVGDAHPLKLKPERSNDPRLVSYNIYTVKVLEVLKGSSEVQKDIRVAFAESASIQGIGELANTFLFLRIPSSAQLKRTSIPSGQDVYVVVNGRDGAVAFQSKSEDQRLAFKTLIDAKSALADSGVNRSLSWAKKYMQSADPFLQKSAIFELYIQSKRPEVVGQLTEALNSAKVLPESKVIALSALESNGSMAALKSLSAVAENEKADSALRKLAVQATGNVAGGEAHIVRWATNRGTILAPAARSVMEVLKSRHPDKPLDK